MRKTSKGRSSDETDLIKSRIFPRSTDGMTRLSHYIKPYIGYIILTMLIKLGGTLLELLIPYFMEIILDTVVPTGSVRGILLYGLFMVLAACGCLAGNILANRMSAVSAGKITLTLRHDLFARLESLSAKQLDTLTVSSAESRMTSDTYNFNQFLARMQRLGIRAPILLLGGIVMMLGMDMTLSLVLIALLPLICLIVFVVTKKSVPLYTEEQGVLDRVVRVLQENITGIRVIKALNKSDHEKRRFNDVNDELTRIDQKAGFISSVTNPSTTLILNLGLTLVVVIGAYRVNGGVSKSGVIIAFLQYFVMILNAMLGITRIFILWSKGAASAIRIADALELPPDLLVRDAEQAEHMGKSGETPHIEFRDVSFSYTGVGYDLSHISFKLMHGESLGILGETGAGKSTIFALLLRLYDADEGTILIDGTDIRTIAKEELCARFGTVFQNDFVAEGTIADNIRFFRNIGDDAVKNAAEDAQAAEFIAKKENGFASAVAVRGNNLSGGQKQRLLIARALAADPEILLLDDASSALDYATDAALRKALHRRHGGTTSLLIAQRVSSVASCTRILVLSDGKTLGYGTHEELLSSCGEYRMIAETQMGEGGMA